MATPLPNGTAPSNLVPLAGVAQPLTSYASAIGPAAALPMVSSMAPHSMAMPTGAAPGMPQAQGFSVSLLHGGGAALPPAAAANPAMASSTLPELRLLEEVGEGSGSKVWKAQLGVVPVAVKILKLQPSMRKEALRGFVQEARILSQMRHPAICTLLTTCMQQGFPALVLEYMSGGSLFDLLHNSKRQLPPTLLSRMALEVASGVNYLHEHSVIHRDVKSANVLLDKEMHAKVSDFGISTNFAPEHTAETGTYRSMAPEVITHQSYDASCDVFSFGVLLWEICHQQIPFAKESGLQAAFAVAMERKRPSITLPHPLGLFAPLIQQCWAHEPAARPPMSRVVVEIMSIDAKVRLQCDALAAATAGAPALHALPTATAQPLLPVPAPLP